MKRYCGVDLGGTNIAAGIVDEEYQILTTASPPRGWTASPWPPPSPRW